MSVVGFNNCINNRVGCSCQVQSLPNVNLKTGFKGNSKLSLSTVDTFVRTDTLNKSVNSTAPLAFLKNRFKQKVQQFLLRFNNLGQKKTDMINVVGKSLIAPVAVLCNPFTKEDKESRKYTALMLPVESLFSLSTTIIASFIFGAGVVSLARKGALGASFTSFKQVGNTIVKKSEQEIINANQNTKVLKDSSYILAAIATIPLNWQTPNIIRFLKKSSPNKAGKLARVGD